MKKESESVIAYREQLEDNVKICNSAFRQINIFLRPQPPESSPINNGSFRIGKSITVTENNSQPRVEYTGEGGYSFIVTPHEQVSSEYPEGKPLSDSAAELVKFSYKTMETSQAIVRKMMEDIKECSPKPAIFDILEKGEKVCTLEWGYVPDPENEAKNKLVVVVHEGQHDLVLTSSLNDRPHNRYGYKMGEEFSLESIGKISTQTEEAEEVTPHDLSLLQMLVTKTFGNNDSIHVSKFHFRDESLGSTFTMDQLQAIYAEERIAYEKECEQRRLFQEEQERVQKEAAQQQYLKEIEAKAIPPDHFTTAQKDTWNYLIQSITSLKAQGKGQILSLVALSGTGKTEITKVMEERELFKDAQVSFVEADRLWGEEEIKKLESGTKSGDIVILTATPYEMEKKNLNGRSEFWQKPHILKTMTAEEVKTFLVSAYGKEQFGSVPVDDLVAHSLGIPFLAKILADMPRLTPESMRGAVGKYILRRAYIYPREDAASKLEPYVSIPMASDITQEDRSSTSLSRNVLYDSENLYLINEIRQKLMEQGYVAPPVEFIDLSSKDMYDEAYSRKEGSSIEVFVPALTEENYELIKEAFGFGKRQIEERGSVMSPLDFRMLQYGTRVKMYGDIVRKLGILLRDKQYGIRTVQAEVATIEENYESLKDIAEQYNGSFNEELPSVLIHKHEHYGMTQPLDVGYLTETLLQQLGIPYTAKNEYANAYYSYDPSHQKIIIHREIYPRNK
ncbi:hypothetical protein HGA88_02060 [Candidatus Roizmanbacteria bacterium]|nr:hypothetical protein [Candidatus Roizmanbacteria bacterium]